MAGNDSTIWREKRTFIDAQTSDARGNARALDKAEGAA
jgi:hypothetical protein